MTLHSLLPEGVVPDPYYENTIAKEKADPEGPAFVVSLLLHWAEDGRSQRSTLTGS
jgi:hypothetical protein